MSITKVIGQLEDILGVLETSEKDQWIISKEQLEEWREELQKQSPVSNNIKVEAATNKEAEHIQYVLSADGSEKGVVLEETDDFCGAESCNGTVYRVEWPNVYRVGWPLDDTSNVTDCCSSGMKELENGDWQIL